MWNSTKRSKREMVETAGHDHRAPILDPVKLANNTLRYRLPDGRTFVRLHLTDIIETAPDGTLTVDIGGYNTHTTRDRLNRFLPAGFRVSTLNGVTYLNRVPFRRRITIAGPATQTDISPDDFPTLSRAARTLLPKLYADDTPEILAADKRAIAKWLKAQKAALRLLRDPRLLEPSDDGAPLRDISAAALAAGTVRLGDVLHVAFGFSAYTPIFQEHVQREIVQNGFTLTPLAARACRRYLNRRLGFAA